MPLDSPSYLQHTGSQGSDFMVPELRLVGHLVKEQHWPSADAVAAAILDTALSSTASIVAI